MFYIIIYQVVNNVIKCYNKLYFVICEVYSMNYGKIIIKLRAKLNITQHEFARILNVSFATVNRWENNKIIPSKRYICILENMCRENGIILGGSND